MHVLIQLLLWNLNSSSHFEVSVEKITTSHDVAGEAKLHHKYGGLQRAEFPVTNQRQTQRQHHAGQ